MLLYAVAISRRVRGTACRRISIPRVPVGIASSIGFQPVFVGTTERCFQDDEDEDDWGRFQEAARRTDLTRRQGGFLV